MPFNAEIKFLLKIRIYSNDWYELRNRIWLMHKLLMHWFLTLNFIPLFQTGPESHELPRIDKYLDSFLNRTQLVKILTDSHSP